MATAVKSDKAVKDPLFSWEGKDRSGKLIRGEMRAGGKASVNATLRRQGITVVNVKEQKFSSGKKIKEKDIAIFTRQLATMMKAGVPLLQAFDISAKGNANPTMSKLLQDIRADVETGSSLSTAFRKHPLHFDALFCNLIAAGEQAGILEDLLDRLAIYKEKTLALKSKIKSAMFYPVAVIIVAVVIVSVIMVFVIPAFKDVFTSFGADLPAPTLMVMAISDFMRSYWYILFGAIGGGIYFLLQAWRRSPEMQKSIDRSLLKVPVFGEIIRKATIARWTRTLGTMFAAGVPLVEALDSVGGASGNAVYTEATKRIQSQVSTGTSLTVAMQEAGVFPPLVTQLVSIGEESGSLEKMLSKVADFFEAEVDDAVAAMSSLIEPILIVFLGVIIGGIVIAMYLPIFKMGQVV
ncbi:MAG: type II secretion system F family protein [Burkholderiales bacterium]|jgi:type IV pilus assembly protein PilC|nr:type II secretion system F family protein [Burkholderiales bacterium]MCA3154719.1 type II secretion system F family protein [Burkholderiales bacterium]MCA3157602.1 type II secretion system F family protein [Burkholderiales bacterium]MCA3168691.1 type II secretion system F family protein [Burkholderiales bacterium]